MAVKRTYKKKVKTVKVKAVAPATAVIQLEDQIKMLIKKDKQIVKTLKPERKYFDTAGTGQINSDSPFQTQLITPGIGTGGQGRIGSKLNNIYLEWRGQITTKPSNVSGGRVDLYVLYYKKQRTTPVGPSSYYDAIVGSSTVGTFINVDANNTWTCNSLRTYDYLKDWKVIAHKKVYIGMNNDPTVTSLISVTNGNGYQAHANFSIKCKLPDLKYNLNSTPTLVDGMVQFLIVCDKGLFQLAAPSLQNVGYNFYYNCRQTYSDN